MENATTFNEVRLGRRAGKRRMLGMQNATTFKEDRANRGLEATFVLEDLKAWYEDLTVVRYSSIDYQLPLLASNPRYRRGPQSMPGPGPGTQCEL